MANIIRTSNSKKPKRKTDSKLRRVGAVVAILLVVGLVVWVIFSYATNSGDGSDEAEYEEKVNALQASGDKANQVYIEAESLVEAGDSEALKAHYDDEIAKVESDIEKASLYLSKALRLTQVDDHEGVLEAALQADRFDGDKQLVSRTEALIANTAYDLRRWELALEYYERQYERVQKEPVDMGDPLPALEERINELKGRIGDE